MWQSSPACRACNGRTGPPRPERGVMIRVALYARLPGRQAAVPDDRRLPGIRTSIIRGASGRPESHQGQDRMRRQFMSKPGKVRKRLGRPGAEADKLDLAVRRHLQDGETDRSWTGTEQELRRQMQGRDMLCKPCGSAAS